MWNSYVSYLRSEEWRIRRKELMREANNTCENCGDKATQLHHLKYDSLGFEIYSVDVIALCKQCHEDLHLMEGKVKEYGAYRDWEGN